MNNIENILTSYDTVILFVYLIACYLMISFTIKNALKLKLIDTPNERASHLIPTPSSGGIVLVLTLPIILLYQFNFTIEILIISMFIIGLIGFIDDRIDLSPKIKFLSQIAIASALFYSDVKIDNLYGFIGIYQLPSLLSYLVTIVLIVGIINAYNLIDGINGLLGSISLINIILFLFIFQSINQSILIITLIIGLFLISFLRFNIGNAKIFMGDTGSLPLGVFFSFLFITMFNENNTGNSSALFMILFPCLDMVRLFASRVKNKKSPFKADKNHYHHLLLKFKNNHLLATFICLILQVVIFSISYITYVNKSFFQAVIITLAVSSLIFVVAEVLLATRNKNDLKLNEKELSKLNKTKRLLINNK